MDRAELQQTLTSVTAQRAAAEHYAQAMRKNLAAWRAQDADRGPLRSALFWSETERWVARLEAFAADIEAHVGNVRTQEVALTEALAKLPAEPPPAPPAEPAPAKATSRSRKKR